MGFDLVGLIVIPMHGGADMKLGTLRELSQIWD